MHLAKLASSDDDRNNFNMSPQEKEIIDSMPSIIKHNSSVLALDNIDQIHDSQNKKLQQGMPLLREELDWWAKANYLPCQMDTVLSLAIIDARNQE